MSTDQEEVLDLIALELDAEREKQMDEYERNVNQEIDYGYIQG